MDFEQFLRKEKSLLSATLQVKCRLKFNVSSISQLKHSLNFMGVKCGLSHWSNNVA